jgi:hypothetical protein
MSIQMNIHGRLTHTDRAGPVENAIVRLLCMNAGESEIATCRTSPSGDFKLDVSCEEGWHVLRCEAFGEREKQEHAFRIGDDGSEREVDLDLPLKFQLTIHNPSGNDERLIPIPYAVVGRRIMMRADTGVDSHVAAYHWQEHRDARMTPHDREVEIVFGRPGRAIIEVAIVDRNEGPDQVRARASREVPVADPDVQTIGGHIRVSMDRTPSHPTLDEALWAVIHERTEAISFDRYYAFIRRVFSLDGREGAHEELSRRLNDLGTRGIEAYRTLKELTELFLLTESGARAHPEPLLASARGIGREREYSREEIEENLNKYLRDGELPYIARVIDAAFPYFDQEGRGYDRLRRRLFRQPLFIELYHELCLEHGMLMRTMEAVSQRFQNVRGNGARDPLAALEIDPLRPLGDVIWHWIQNEPLRLTPKRRIAEYHHGYGHTVIGDDMPGLRTADVRTSFPEAFSILLSQCEIFYKEDNQTTVIADAFPVLNSLKEVHQILAMGAGNAAPQLTFTARVETLLMQLMLAQPELRSFLRTRIMVPYEEPWMGQVDSMKELQGWQQPSITHYRDLAHFGERLLLSIRLGDWTAGDEASARNWLRHHKNAVRRYTHAHRAVTGIDLTNPMVVASMRPTLSLESRPSLQRVRSPAEGNLGFTPAISQPVARLAGRGRVME